MAEQQSVHLREGMTCVLMRWQMAQRRWYPGQGGLGNLCRFSCAVEDAPGCMVGFASSIAAMELEALKSSFALHS